MTVRRVVALAPDLMDRSRIQAAGTGLDLVFVRQPADLPGAAEGADLVVVDLRAPGILEALAGLPDAETVGFGSHVDRDRLRAARAAGCRVVLARSAFFQRLSQLLAGS